MIFVFGGVFWVKSECFFPGRSWCVVLPPNWP